MSKQRKSLPKKIRFEVFKRDRFTCQYCGRMSPDVILEVDHITPVSKGGKDDLINLITSCRDCNRGKGKELLSETVEVKKTQRELLDLAEKTEQAKMIIEWKKEMLSVREEEAAAINDLIQSITGYSLNESGLIDIKKYLKQFPFSVVWDATEISFYKYFHEDNSDYWTDKYFANAIKKIGGICYNKTKDGVSNGDI